MDSMEVNKGIAAILIGGIAFFLTGLIGDNLVRETLPEKPVLNIATAPAAGAAAAAPEQVPPIAPLLAKADVKTGEQFAHRVCIACHTFDKGAKPGIGPNLYGVVGGPHDHEEGFNYSPALEKFKGQPWTFDALNEWLLKPGADVPGTRMTFAGIPNAQQRADVIAYLRSLSDSPVPLPAPEAAPPAATPAAAPGAAPAASPPGASTHGWPQLRAHPRARSAPTCRGAWRTSTRTVRVSPRSVTDRTDRAGWQHGRGSAKRAGRFVAAGRGARGGSSDTGETMMALLAAG